MSQPRGRCLPISLPRRWIGDFLHFARKVPCVVVQRQANLAELAKARASGAGRLSWCALFTKAFALVARDFAVLRRAYLPLPWPHFYEHPGSTASVALERDHGDEKAVVFVQLRSPEERPLDELDAALRHFKQAPLESLGAYRRLRRLSRLPRPLRRLAWWLGLNLSGRGRAKHMGTFGVSVYSALGAESFSNLTLLTSSLGYGVISRAGDVSVRIAYDHRVMDGATVARALAALEEVLNREILTELTRLPGSCAA